MVNSIEILLGVVMFYMPINIQKLNLSRTKNPTRLNLNCLGATISLESISWWIV